MSNIQLSSVENFQVNDIVFSEAKETTIPGSYRITIGTKYKDNTMGPLVFTTDVLYCFGIQENKSLEKPPRTTGYSIPLCMWSKDGATEYQKKFIDTLNNVCEYMKKYILKSEVKKSVKKYDLEMSDLRKFNPLWYKKEEGKIVEGRGPMLYPKLMCNKDLHVYTLITNQEGDDLSWETLLNQKFSGKICIKIESIFIGSKISLQLKVLEMEVQQQGNRRKRLICKEPSKVTEIAEEDDIDLSEHM